MAGAKLLIRRLKRTAKDIDWYKTTDEQKATISDASKKEHRSITARRHFHNGLRLYYIKFFPRVALYDAYVADAGMKAINDARAAYNTEKGIDEKEIIIDMPNFNM